MRYVLGMAKSSLDTRGGKGRNLELDFVRLVLAVRTKIAGGADAHGYLMVLDERVKARACNWRQRYEAKDLVTVLVHDATVDEQEVLREEKRLNALAITTHSAASPSASVASFGEKIGEDALRTAIWQREGDVEENPLGIAAPLGVRWDFFGIRMVNGA